ncbi:hypothetical protein L1049_007405 [Liquidambar formosana]|uniref:Uncharacterized protein n=1 Tax=Liquidambar formosana TaxID=63359 RepID=A0AAP0N5Q1_LIQFO
MHKVPQMLGDWMISVRGAEEKASIPPSKDPKEMQWIISIKPVEEVTTTPSNDPKETHVVPQPQGDTEEAWIKNLIESAEEKETSTQSAGSEVMHKVPQMLQDTMANCEGYGKPSVVSIGPYHHGDTRLEEVQNLKPKIAKHFHGKVKEDDLRKFFEHFEAEIEGKMVKEAEIERKMGKEAEIEGKMGKFEARYNIDSTDVNAKKAFRQLMFLDGCFILGFIECVATERLDKLGMKNNLINLVQKDLFLLENQLPYQVLHMLIKLRNNDRIADCWEKWLAEFIDWNNSFSYTWREYRSPFYRKYRAPQKIESHHHLLHIQRERILGKRSRHIRFCLPASCEDSDRIHLFRGVKELTEAGIKLRPNQTGYIKDVNFWSYGVSGCLTLPRMIIDNSTRLMFFNLIAYEECMTKTDEFWFTSYIGFLDLLIDHAEDVKELRTAGILDNRLGSDEQVAQLFNEMTVNLKPKCDTYDNIKRRIRCHFSVRKKFELVLWMLEGIRDHFKSPITYLALLGGLIVFSLGALQTYFAGLSVLSPNPSLRH